MSALGQQRTCRAEIAMSALGQVQTSGSLDLEGKRLELLKDTVSGLSRGARYATGIIRSNGEPPWQDKAADRAALSLNVGRR
jgi:hypothetical protein